VDVLSVVTGGVKTQGQTYFGHFTLPGDSYYKKIEETIASRARGEEGMPRMGATEYADEVVKEILKRTTGKIWCGFNAQMVRDSTSSSVPQSAMVSYATYACMHAAGSQDCDRLICSRMLGL
jgi:1-acylglycerone phosphate reductase